jgi:DNA-binding transcriptional LysR family regulator
MGWRDVTIARTYRSLGQADGQGNQISCMGCMQICMTPTMDWNDLRIFLAVARAGSLGGAARAPCQTQPTMGRHITRLEQAVGHKLFQRSSGGFVPTEEGVAALAHAERMEAEAIGFERLLAGHGERLDGLLRISSPDWIGIHLLAPIFADFTRAHSLVTIDLVTDPRPFSLTKREADLVFRVRPVDEPEVVQRKLMHLDYALYIAAGTSHPPTDGAGCALVTMDTALGELPDLAWLRRLLPRARTVFRSANRDAQARMCAAGAGLAVLPRLIGDRMDGLT